MTETEALDRLGTVRKSYRALEKNHIVDVGAKELLLKEAEVALVEFLLADD